MTISITCPSCYRRYEKIKPEYAGRKVRCSCGKMIRVVDTGELTDSSIDEVITEQPKMKKGGAISWDDKPAPKKSNPKAPPLPRPKTAIDVDPKVAIDVHYSDLEDILAKTPATDNQFDPRVPIKRTAQTINASAETPIRNRQPLSDGEKDGGNVGTKSRTKGGGSTHHGLSFLLAIISASLAFWFSIFLIFVKFSGLRSPWIQLFSRSFSAIYSGQVGVDEMVPGLKNSLVGAGWIILVLAFLFAFLAIVQFANAAVVMLARKTLFRWSDGLLASVAIGLIFVLIGTIFLHSRHISSLKQKIEAAASGQPDEMTTITALKKDLVDRDRSFIGAIAISSMIPLCVFVCSMIRLFLHDTRTDEKTLE